jgi:hypothetical protein
MVNEPFTAGQGAEGLKSPSANPVFLVREGPFSQCIEINASTRSSLYSIRKQPAGQTGISFQCEFTNEGKRAQIKKTGVRPEHRPYSTGITGQVTLYISRLVVIFYKTKIDVLN